MARLYATYSSKGGAGKTFAAVNLATGLHEETKSAVLLLDCNVPVSNDVRAALNTEDVRYIDNLLPMANTIHSNVLASYATNHSSGIGLLGLISGESQTAPDTKENAELLQILLKKISQRYRFIVADLGLPLGPLAQSIMDLADGVILLTESDPVSLRSTTEDLELLQQRNYAHTLMHVALNMRNGHDSITPEWIESHMGVSLSAVIPKNTQLPYPFLESDRKASLKSPIRKSLEELILHLLQKPPSELLNSEEFSIESSTSTTTPSDDELDIVKLNIHRKVLALPDLKRLDTEVQDNPEKFRELEIIVRNRIIEILDQDTDIRQREIRDRIVLEVLQEVLKLGPLEDLLDDPSVTEIMVNRWDEIYVERKGKLTKTAQKFLSESQLRCIIERIVAPLGRRIDLSSPMVDARLADGSRVNAIIPPLALKGGTLTIRKFSEAVLKIDELITYGSLNQQIADFLNAAVVSKLNVIVSGGTSSGKTTLLNTLSSFIPADQRIITVEDSAELRLVQPHIVTLEARPPNIEGKGEITIRDLVRNALRMRPDRIVVGECRSGETLDMLQAMNTGHDGSMTTIHANSSHEALTRIETLVMFTGLELPSRAIREQIAGAVNLLIQVARLKDGSRRLLQISEVTGIVDGVVTAEDIFVFEHSSIDEDGRIHGSFVSTGYVPKCLDKFENAGVAIPREMFWSS